MLGQQPSALRLLKARLSWRIVTWVFVSIVAVESVILVPSYARREQEQLAQLEGVSFEVLSSLLRRTEDDFLSNPDLSTIAQKLNPDSVIVGGALYTPTGELVSYFGELPTIASADLNPQTMMRDRSYQGDRYDVSWPAEKLNNQYILVVRHDSSFVQADLIAYTIRIAGLVVIISLVVTVATMLALGKTVITPVLKLRDDLIAAGEAIGKDQTDPQFHALTVHRQDELGEVMTAFKQMFYRIRQEIADRQQAEAALRLEQEKSERLLLNILPAAIAQQLKQDQRAVANRFEAVTILFADIVDFTKLAAHISASDLVALLNEIFSAFDTLAERYQLEKIKTIGDAYMVVGGLPMARHDHAEAIADMALAMQQVISQFQTHLNQPFQLRIGINTGAVVSGVIGLKKFSYDLWGDAVNIASRMESQGIPGKVQVTATTYACLQDKYLLEPRGSIPVKGRGEMLTYFLLGKKNKDDIEVEMPSRLSI